MGHLLQILLALGAQAAAEAGLELDVEAPLGVLALACAPYLLARGARTAALAGRFGLAAALARILGSLPVVLHFVGVALLGWRRSVARWTGGDASLFEWPSAALLLVFLPFVGFAFATFDAQARLRAEQRQAQRSMLALELRMFSAGLSPLCVYVLCSAAIGLSKEIRVRIEEITVWSALYSLAFFALMLLVLPRLLRASFDTAPMPAGEARRMLEEVARKAAFRCRDLLVWRTGHLVPNAAIIGLWARQRLVVFSDSLLAMLRPRELAAVYAHEIGHAARRHASIFLVWTGAFFLSADLVATWIDPEGELVTLGLLAAALVAWFIGFGWLSRRFELDADLYSLDLLGEGESLASALEAVGGNLRDVASWRHFSPTDRAAFLRRVAREPDHARAFRSRLRRLGLLGAGLFALAVVFELRELWKSYTPQAALADMRLGRFDEAAARVSALERSNRVAALAAVAGRAEEEALRALGEEGAERALDWLRFGAQAGAEQLGAVAEALELALAGQRDEAQQRLGSSQPEWWDRIEAWLDDQDAAQ